MPASAELHVRRVGFRAGTDEELRVLHAVSAPIEAERRPGLVPQPVESYIAFAQKLPSQFDDHAWVAETADRPPVAAGFCWSNSAGDRRVMECDVLVRRDRRRQGIGRRLLAEICDETVNDGRSVLTWSTFDAVPAGDAFARYVGARLARVNRTSELAVADVDWAMVERWTRAEQTRRLGYRLETIDGVFPTHLRADAAAFHHIMQTAPRENLDVGDVMIDEEFVAELDRALVEAGRTRWTVLVRSPTGECVGGTEVIFEPWDPGIGLQQNTGIDLAHRRLGLARWAKASVLARIRRERPEVARVRTDNASSNDSMLGINRSLGFTLISTRTEWQADPSAVLRACR